jgi:hypothetical protein
MTVTLKDGLFTFGSNEIVEVPPSLTVTASGDIESTNDADQKAPLGILYRHKGNVYRYVLFDNGASVSQVSAVACIAGGVMVWETLDPPNGKFTVTSAYAARLGKSTVAGIALRVITNGYYSWIQVGGVHLLVSVNTSNAAGDVMIYADVDNTFGRCAADAAVTGMPFGVALAVDSPTGYGPVLLMNLIW